MVTLLVLLIGIPLAFIAYKIQQEAANLYLHLQKQINHGRLSLPNGFSDMPLLGHYLQDWVDRINNNPDSLYAKARQWVEDHLNMGHKFSASYHRPCLPLAC